MQSTVDLHGSHMTRIFFNPKSQAFYLHLTQCFSDVHCAIEFSLKQATLTQKEAKQTHIDVESADIQK